MKIDRHRRRLLQTIRTIGAAARAELDEHHEHLGVKPHLGRACAFASVLYARSHALFMQRQRARAKKYHESPLFPFYRTPVIGCGWFATTKDGASQHCWVEIGNVIVDLTATQFGRFPHVRICPRTNRRYVSLVCAGREADALVNHFEPSPRRRRRLLDSMVYRVIKQAESELGR